MHSFGFHPRPQQVISLNTFMADNLVGFSRMINPQQPVQVFHEINPPPLSNDPSAPPWLAAYNKRAVMKIDNGTQSVEHAVAINLATLQIMLDQGRPMPDLILFCWETVLHELRHWIQCTRLNQSELFPKSILEMIKQTNPRRITAMESDLATYSEEEYPSELDAMVIQAIGSGIVLRSSNGGNLDEHQVCALLQLTSNELTPDPHKWLQYC